jgi:proline iminopeptidase
MLRNHIITSGNLNVGNGHALYWEEWGNPDGPAIMHLHGGPGASFNDSHKAIYDPSIHRVIFYDQRGNGKSQPFASTDHNTTQDLIADIERLREHFKLDTMYVAGGSWGSTLALLYAIAHPKRVRRLFLWSLYLIRQFENDWVNEGYPRYNFPEEWERFIGLVPKEHRTNGTTIMQYYANKMRSPDAAEARRHAFEWTLWEAALLSTTLQKMNRR